MYFGGFLDFGGGVGLGEIFEDGGRGDGGRVESDRVSVYLIFLLMVFSCF